MERPTKIEVNRINEDNYKIVCVDELTGSSCSINMPKNGYDALAAFFGKEAMEKISHESSGLSKHDVNQQRELLNAFVEAYNKDAVGAEVITAWAVDDFLKGVL